MASYKLTVSVCTTGPAKYHYRVFDESGIVISQRKSNRVYVACTINGLFYFGRIDLIGKGDHGRYVKQRIEAGEADTPIAYSELL